MEISDRIANLLRDAQAPLVPIGQLCRQAGLTEDEATGDGLRDLLAHSPERFVVLERPRLFAGAEHWAREERAAYADALRAAGFETRPLIGAVASTQASEGDPSRDASPVDRVVASLAEIAGAAPHEGPLRTSLWDSLPLAEATMRVLAEAWKARSRSEEGPEAVDARAAG